MGIDDRQQPPQQGMTVIDPENTELDNTPMFATGQALDVLARGEIDIQISTAHRFPRSVRRALQEAITLATMDEDTADSCFYELPARGDEGPIKGASIRL